LCVSSFIYFKYKYIVRITFGANLDAQNAGNDISGIQISNIPPDPSFMRGILATHVAFGHCYPPLIYYLTERSLFKKCPPTGKSLKKALTAVYLLHVLTQDQEPITAPVTKDILEMGKYAKVYTII
jgi:hypothetical protein